MATGSKNNDYYYHNYYYKQTHLSCSGHFMYVHLNACVHC